MRNKYLFLVHHLPERTDDGIGKEIKFGSPKILYDELETAVIRTRNTLKRWPIPQIEGAFCRVCPRVAALNLFRKYE
jgi:hypothetical protein